MAELHEIQLLGASLGAAGELEHSCLGCFGIHTLEWELTKAPGTAANDSASLVFIYTAYDASDAAHDLLAGAAASGTAAAGYYTELRRRVSELLGQRSKSAALEVLKAGIYCLESFVQNNLCG